jgi:hypothetical protein
MNTTGPLAWGTAGRTRRGQTETGDRCTELGLPDGALHLDDSFASKTKFRLIQSPPWRLYRFLAIRSRVLQLTRAGYRAMAHERREAETVGTEAGLDELVLSPSTDPRWQEAWRVTEALVVEISREAARQGAEMLVVGVPWAAQILPDLRAREAFATRLGVSELSQADRRLETIGRAHDIPVLTLGAGMGDVALASGTYLNGFEPHLGIGHWNPAGHRAAADLIARSLCSGLHRGAVTSPVDGSRAGRDVASWTSSAP